MGISAAVTMLGVVLLAVGIADLTAAGLAGHPVRDAGWGTATAGLVAVPAGMVTGLGTGGTLAATAVAAGGTSAWLRLRDGPDLDAARAWGALGVLAAIPVLVVLANAAVSPDPSPPLAWLLERSDVPVLTVAAVPRTVASAGLAVALLATANAAVRLVLIAAGPEVARSETRLRGGRLIGAAERLLLFGLAAAGAVIAAGFVLGAKSLLRFPELTTLARSGGTSDEPSGGETTLAGVDAVTEYFLLGSLVSWTLGLAPALLLTGGVVLRLT